MLKKIPVEQLSLGMHLQSFCGAWLDHPFWRTKFVLADSNDITLILESPIKEVIIDISKGLDVEGSDAASPPEMTPAAAPPAGSPRCSGKNLVQ